MMHRILQLVFMGAAFAPLACTSSSPPGDTDVPSCSDGYSDCGGTCTDLSGDGQSCGTCTTSCTAQQVCSAGTCQDSCTEPGRTQCESSCVDLLTNPNHCGGCGAVCDNGQTCQGGICASGPDTSGSGGSGTGGASGSFSTEVLLEEGELGQCEVDGVVESTHAGFSGTGYLNTDNLTGASIEWAVDIGEAGTYSLEISYANEPAADRPGDVLVGGMMAASGVSFPSTGSWTSYSSATVDVTLAAGENRIVLQATEATGLANIDSLKVSGAAVSAFDCDGNMGTGGTVGTGGGQGTGGGDGYPLGNPAVPSAGCGQSPTLASGTNYMTSAGLDREYILSVPANYDPNTPYRVVFGMHWYGGSAEAVEGWSGWFGLAALDGDTTIFVAPQGYTNGSPWRGNDDRDHTFFDDLYSTLASDLCIDTSRVFSVGFSFGAMFTNSLAQTHQNVLRGIVLYAAADYNIYFPENTGEPLAFMGVHGLHDPTCPIESGRRSRDRFVENNRCTAPANVPEATSGNHVIYDYEECPNNYPIRWVTFDGAHTYPPNDEEGTWVHPVAWEFISQF